MTEFFNNLLELSLEAAPWLLLGLIIGGLIKAWLPTRFVEQQLNGKGFKPVVKASIIGAPLPLCSCGVIPAALGLRHAGASKPATVSFLVSTPETGVDSVSVTYALLGPFMAIVRPVAAIASALVSGAMVMLTDKHSAAPATSSPSALAAGCCDSEATAGANAALSTSAEGKLDSCCADTVTLPVVAAPESCCGSDASTSCCAPTPEPDSRSTRPDHLPQWARQAIAGLQYAFVQLFADILMWLAAGLVFAAAIQTFVPADFLARWGSGLPAMLMMALIGIPMYVCATASTPIAAGLLMAGISPGTALVFLMAGPATNVSTLGVIGKELGRRPLIAYLSGVIVVALIAGLVVDALIAYWQIDIRTQLTHAHIVPDWLAAISLAILAVVASNALWKKKKH
ncbi:MAG: SO_0444 family Cu/Zn efflux transporter [Thiotrichales bacterium]